MVRIGVISDTHGLLRPQAVAALRGCDAIVHAGDIGGPGILDALAGIGPVTAVRGNNDRGAWAAALPECRAVDFGAARVWLLHDRNALRAHPAPPACNIIVTGHSHRPAIERHDDVLFVNPGSAGPRRFRLPVSLALLYVAHTVRADIVELPV